MKYPIKWTALFLSAAVLIGTLSACGPSSGTEGDSDAPIQTSASSEATASRAPAASNLTDATSITLTGSGASIEGKGAAAEGSVVTITAAGVYTVSGSLKDGRIIVNAPKEDVTVVLNGADITCSYGSPLYIYKAGTATVHLMEGTENTLTDGFSYTFDDTYSSKTDEEPNACLYSKADLVIEGAGKLTVTANCNNGITSKDTLQIYDSTISVTAVNHGINGKDSNTIDGASITVTCGGDAIRSKGNLTVSGGSYIISAGDDALHADEALTVSDGEIDIQASYEGLEGTTVTVSGGTIRIISSDDGLNAAGGADGSGFGGFGHGNAFGGGNPDSRIEISGGYLVVMAGGDGLDSNGDAVMSGGTVIVSSTGPNDGALDYEGSFTLSGGTLLALDSGNMSQAPNQASQYIVSLGFDGFLSAGTYVSLSNENQSFVWELPISANNLVFSSPDLEGGAAYTVSYGGDYSGESADGIGSGGAYSGGTDLTTLTLSDYITTYGNRGMGNMGGRPDDMPMEKGGDRRDPSGNAFRIP